MLVNIMDELKNDEDIEDIVKNAAKVLVKYNVVDEEYDFYGEFKNGIDEAKAELNKKIEKANNDNPVILRDYVNGDHKIVGRSASYDADKLIAEYVVVKSGDKYACRTNVGGRAEVKGTFTKKNGVVNGKYTIDYSGKEYATLEITDLDADALKEGTLKGKMRITPSKRLLKEVLDTSTASVLSMLDPSIEVEADITFNKSGKGCVRITSGDEELIGLYFTMSEEYDITGITKPSGDIIDIVDTDELIDSIDLDPLFDALRKTSIPDEYIDMIEEAVKNEINLAKNNYVLYDDSDDDDDDYIYDDFSDDYDDYDDDYDDDNDG